MSKLNLLVAYPYMKPDVIEAIYRNKDDIRFLLDSGAFTAWKANKEIKLDDYCRFIESLPFKPWRYFTLDVVGDPEKSFENYQIMLKRGFTPIPIFTRGEDVRMIDEYYKTSDVLGIGGLVKTQKNLGFVKGIMSLIGERKVHWLGFVRHNFINYYKPYMCDASSWSYASRVGDLKVYLGNGIIKSFRKIDFIKKPPQKYIDIILKYGVSLDELRSQEFWHNGKKLNQLTGKMWVKRSLETQSKIGTHLFLAAGSSQDIIDLHNHYKEYTS